MGGIPTELRIMINTMAAKALRDLQRVEQMLMRIRKAGLDTPLVTTSVSNTAFTQVTRLDQQLQNLRNAQASRPPPINTAVSKKAFSEIAALNQQIDRMRTQGIAASAATGAAASSSVSSISKAAVAGAGATAVMTSGARESGKAMKATGDDFQKTSGLMGSFMNAQNSRLRAFGSEVQWTGRQMIHHLTMPFVMMGAYAGKTWFDQADVMTGVAKVYGDTSQEVAGGAQAIANELEALESVATKLSETYGRNREEVLQVAEAWAVAGASGTALAESMNLTMQASVLGSMDAVKASESLIAIQAQYGVSTEGLTKILAQLNYAGNKTALDIEDLAAGFQRAASVARSSGMSAAHLAGMLATIAPAAGTAEQAGNGLRMIMTRIQSQTSDTSRVIGYMNEQLGDSMISMKEFYGLPMEQKLFHLSRGYNKLGDAQRTQAAAMIAGGHQVGRMEILLRELGNEQGYYNKIINELQDDSVIAREMFQELTKNLTSDPRRIQQAWQRFRNGMAEAFVPLIPIVTHFINTIGDLVKRFAAMDPALQKLVVGIALTFAMIGPLIVAMGVFALTAAQLAPLFKAVGTVLYWLTAGPFVAVFKGIRNVTVGLLATGETFDNLGPKMKRFSGTVGNVTGRLNSFVGGPIKRLSSFVFSDFMGLSKIPGMVNARMAKVTTLLTGWYQKQTAINSANSVVNAFIAAKEWIARNTVAATGWAKRTALEAVGNAKLAASNVAGGTKRVATTAATEASLIAMGNSGWSARIAATLRGWGSIITINRTAGTATLVQQASTEAGTHAIIAKSWGVRHVLNATNWAQQHAQHMAQNVREFAIDAAGFARRRGLAMLHWKYILGGQMATYIKAIAMSIGHWAMRFKVVAAGHKAITTAYAFGQAVLTAITYAGGVKQLAAIKTTQALKLIATRKFWVGMLTTTLKGLGRMAAAIFAAMTGPIGIAIMAGVAIFMLFGDKIRDVVEAIKGYFQNLPQGVRDGLQPIVNLWNNVVGGIQAAWNKLPGFIQAPLRAVFNMIRKAMEGIRTLLSFMNPFQRHSPSLVDNVNAGMDIIGKKFQDTSSSVQGSVNAMSAAVAGLRSSFATLDAMNTAAKRAEDVENIRAAGGPDAEAQVAAYQNVTAQVDRMKAKLVPLNRDIQRQEQVVNAAAAAVERADKNIDSMNKQLDAMKSHADAVSASLDAARERLDHFSSASIQGMGAVEDATFANSMAQKELQLQIARLEETAGTATGGASDHFARLQGDIESLSGQRMELHFAGAGSDITDVYKGMESQLRDEQLNIGGVGVDSGPGAEITKLQDALADLERQAEIMDLEAALKFDPLTRQIEKMTDATVELPFSTIVSGVRSSQGEISSLERTYDAATTAVRDQEAAIKQAEAARDVLSARHSEQDEALKALTDTYSAIEESIREAESALGDMTGAAEESIRRVEELARKQEEAARKAKGAGGAGGSDSMSPRFSAFMEAEGAAEFGDPGGGFTIGREGLDIDQSAAMEDFNPLEGMPELDELIGNFDMLSPIKDAWQKVVDWWNNTVFPMKNPLGDMLGGIGEAVNVNLGGENMTVMENFSGWWDKLVGIWNDWVWPALTFIGEAMRNTLTPAIENLRNVFANNLAPILQRVGERFQEMWPHIKELFAALWDIGKWILAFFIGKVLLKLIVIFTAVWAVITIGINMLSHMLAPVLSWIGDMIESIILIVQGVIRVISGAINIVMGLIKTVIGAIKGMFTGDWSMALDGLDQLWQGVKDFIGGIIDIFHGLLRAIVSTIVNGARLVWGAIWGLVEGVIDFFKGLYNTIVGNSIIPDMVNAIVDWIASLPGKVWGFLKDLVSGAIGFFTDLKDQAIARIKFLYYGVTNLVQDLKDAVIEKAIEMAENFVRNVTSIKDKVLGFFRNAKDWLVDTGKDLIQGLINGVKGMATWLRDAILDLVPSALRGPLEKALGIESPSRVFMGIGHDIVDGLIVGVDQKSDEVASSMSALADVAAAVEIAAPAVLAAETVDVPALPDVPMIDAPAAITAPDMEMPDFSTPDMDALLASFNEFDAQYQVSVDGHTAGVEAEHAAMFANLDAQFQTWSAGSLAAYANYTLAVGTILSAFAQSATALYVNLWNTLASTTASGANNISSVLSSGTSAWLSLLTAFINALLTAWANLINQLASLLTTGANNITSIWQSLANNFNKIFSDGIKPVFDAFLPMLETLEGWFRSTVDNIGAIWGEVEPKTKDPARIVINDVYDTGLRGAWNNFNEFLELPELPSYRAAFASGGVLPGYTPGRDVHRFISPTGGMLDLSGGEAIMRPEFTRAVGTAGVDRLNKIAAQGGVSGLGRAFEHMSLGGYAAGGVLPYIGGFNPGGVIYGGNYGGLSPITRTHAEWVGKHFPNMFTLTSAWRHTDSGYHSTGRATDWQATDGHFATQMPTPYSKGLARAIHATFPNAAELIHWPLDGWQNIWHGSPHNYDGTTNSQHANHVHFATQGPIQGGIALGSFEGGITPLNWSEYISDKFEEELGAVADKAPNIGGGIGEWIPAAIEKSMEAATFLSDYAEEYFESMMDPAGPVIERWRPLAMQALARHGYDPAQHIEATLKQIEYESSGDPKSINLWDSNAIAGHPSGGLLHVIEPTYQRVKAAYPEAFEGLPDDRWHPLTNLTAGVGAVKLDWGISRWPTRAGYDEGGILPPTPGGFGTFYNHTRKPEAVLTSPQWDNIYRAADAATELSYEDIVRAFKGGLSSNEFESTLDRSVVQKLDPRWKELELSIYDAAELVAVTSDENTTTWLDEFERIGGEVKDFFTKASEFMFSVQEAAEFLASDEFWDKVKENSGESWEPAKEAFDHLSGVVQDELGSLNNITIESFGGIENAGRLLGVAGDALHQLVFDNFNVVGALNSLRAGVGGGGEVPQILQGMFEVLESGDNAAMVHQLQEHGRVVADAVGRTLMELDFGKYYAPLIDKMAEWLDSFPRYQAQYAANTTTGFANSIESIMTRPLETMTNLLGGIYNTFMDIAPTLLRGVSGIGSSLSSFAGSNAAAMGAIVTAVVTGDPLGLIPHIPQLLALAVELIPQIIDVIINIVPTLIRSIIDLFTNFMPWSNQGYDTAEEALKASISVSKKIDDNERLFFGDGEHGSGRGTDPGSWRPEGASGNQNNFYGDLSFPNVTNEDDAKGFIENLSRL